MAREAPAPDGFCGDEDNGEMAAWALCAITGLFPACPGRADWLCLRPPWGRVILRAPGRPPLELNPAKGDSADWMAGRFIPHTEILAGGTRRVGFEA